MKKNLEKTKECDDGAAAADGAAVQPDGLGQTLVPA